MEHRDLLAGLVPLHILHHAAAGPVYGQWIIGELARHGYRVGPGTLYPMLHAMERNGYLVSTEKRASRRIRRVYRTTPAGRKALREAKARLRELWAELIERR